MTPIKTPFGGTLEFYPLPDTSSKGTVLICPAAATAFSQSGRETDRRCI